MQASLITSELSYFVSNDQQYTNIFIKNNATDDYSVAEVALFTKQQQPYIYGQRINLYVELLVDDGHGLQLQVPRLGAGAQVASGHHHGFD